MYTVLFVLYKNQPDGFPDNPPPPKKKAQFRNGYVFVACMCFVGSGCSPFNYLVSLCYSALFICCFLYSSSVCVLTVTHLFHSTPKSILLEQYHRLPNTYQSQLRNAVSVKLWSTALLPLQNTIYNIPTALPR